MGKPIIWSGVNAKLINSGDLIDKNNVSLTQGAKLTITQSSHGYTSADVGCALYLNSSGFYVKALADNLATSQVAGFIYSIINTNVFVLATGGKSLTVGANFLDGGGSLTVGDQYYLSPTAAGKVTATEPTSSGYVSKPLGVAISATEMLFNNQRGNVIGGGVAGTVPVGTIVAYNPGYYTNGTNGGFTVVGPTSNTIAAVNAFLNLSGWFVCDGDVVTVGSSPIWNGAGRYLPQLNNSRFLMGSTTAGTAAGANTTDISHTHSVTSNVTVGNHTLAANQIPQISTSYTPAGSVDIQHTHGTSQLNVNKNTELNSNQNSHSHVQNVNSGGAGSLISTQGVSSTAGNYGGSVTPTQLSSVTWVASTFFSTAATASGQTLGATSRPLTGSAATITVGTASGSLQPVTHSVANNAVTSGAPSVTSVNTVPQYLTTYYIVRVF